jgi:hypothetical protein
LERPICQDGIFTGVKLDPIEIAKESSSSLIARVSATWLAAGGGLVLAFLLSERPDVIALGGMVLFLPILLFGLAAGSGWWFFVGLPAMGLLAWRAFVYIRGETSGEELLPIGGLSFLICIRPRGSNWVIELLFAGLAMWMVIHFYRQKRVTRGEES